MTDEQKEFLKHLKSVSLSVTLAAVALLIAGTLPTSGSLEKAYSQAQEIRGSVHNMTGEWYRSVLERQGWLAWGDIEDPEDQRPVRSFGFSLAHGGQQIGASFAVLNVEPEYRYLTAPFPTLAVSDSRPHPTTIAEFQQNWDDLRDRTNQQRLLVPNWRDASVFHIRDEHSGPEASVIGPVAARGMADGYGLIASYLDVSADEQWIVRVQGASYFRALSDRWGDYQYPAASGESLDHVHPLIGEREDPKLRISSVLLPLSAQERGVDFQKEFAAQVEKSWRSLPFEEAFRELGKEARGLETLDLGQLEAFLDRRRGEVGEKLQIFGLTVPAAAIGIWGMVILLGIQSYAYANYKQYTRLYPNGLSANFPWIALYQDARSRVLFLGSVGFLPILASCISAIRAIGTGNWVVVVALAVGSMAVSLATGAWLIRNAPKETRPP